MKQLLEISQVSEIVGLSESTLYQQRHRRVGIGALALRVGRHLRWRRFADREPGVCSIAISVCL